MWFISALINDDSYWIFQLAAYKKVWLGDIRGSWGISWASLKKMWQAWKDDDVWKKVRDAWKIFECATGLDSWDNQERVEYVRRRYVGRPTGSSRDGPGILETEPLTVSSFTALGYILLWFVIQVFWVKIWATGLV
jgi:hypothetical protein